MKGGVCAEVPRTLAVDDKGESAFPLSSLLLLTEAGLAGFPRLRGAAPHRVAPGKP